MFPTLKQIELATGLAAHSARDPDEDHVEEVLMFCPSCAERESGALVGRVKVS